MTAATPEGLHVTALTVYPVKSLAGIPVDEALVETRGLHGDRRWAVVDPEGTKVTAREEHALLGLRAEPLDDGGVRLVAPGADALELAAPRGAAPVPVAFSGQEQALSAGAHADAWLTARVGRPLRLVWQDDETHRPIRPDMGGADGDSNSLSDAAPLHVTSESSLARLNDWLLETAAERGEQPRDPLGHDRFRPNVVVSGSEPFAEDSWTTVRLGDVPFRATMVCDRCVMTTVDRVELRTGKEPIRTLARHRKWDGATWFGIRLTPVLPLVEGAVLRVGDPVDPA
ncbi:MOSC domain-containing protein [Terracoccus sp. 273MFTsu3.1]|uniref:MOSC domain-containing protein n=1 Tax=Terracoccus sp. 273MFTsu3.1 TaxID=1172188 RepID=UPI0003709BA1|nr:MOSC N-terminal beta barrel domain-containing protein [Terracoccus sp. 273MFTsu3.1]